MDLGGWDGGFVCGLEWWGCGWIEVGGMWFEGRLWYKEMVVDRMVVRVNGVVDSMMDGHGEWGSEWVKS